MEARPLTDRFQARTVEEVTIGTEALQRPVSSQSHRPDPDRGGLLITRRARANLRL